MRLGLLPRGEQAGVLRVEMGGERGGLSEEGGERGGGRVQRGVEVGEGGEERVEVGGWF